MTISVLIPCYKRVDDLRRNLDALRLQERLPEQVVLTVRETDDAIRGFLKDYDPSPLSLTIATAPETGGFISAINAGLQEITGEITVLTDDDIEAHPDWIRKIEDYFLSDSTIGGVGGRDIQLHESDATKSEVGIFKWWGNVVGNHHIGKGEARLVDVIKGANCAYRTAPFRVVGFDTRLLGYGAQVHTEVVLGLCFRRAGWKIIYDPAVLINHYPGVRFDIDQRGRFNEEAHFHQSHNRAMAVWEHLKPVQRIVFFFWAILIGNRVDPGLVQTLRLFRSEPYVFRKAQVSLRGLFAGIRTANRTKRPETFSPDAATASPVPASAIRR
ncbi:MAG: glycosyltransferase family 2 protein [Armatimonadetes bacterium]|nr:glycosyltransferase family 2 protein [Armatimonadota bacterium]